MLFYKSKDLYTALINCEYNNKMIYMTTMRMTFMYQSKSVTFAGTALNGTTGVRKFELLSSNISLTWHTALELCRSERGRDLVSFTDASSEIVREWLLGGYFVRNSFFIGESDLSTLSATMVTVAVMAAILLI